MTILVDEIIEYPPEMTTAKGLPGRRWCHLWSTLEGEAASRELLAFTSRIGLMSRWRQLPGTTREHFDLTPGKREAAVKAGAIEVNSRAYARARLAGEEALMTYLKSVRPATPRPVFGVTPAPDESRGYLDGGGRRLRP